MTESRALPAAGGLIAFGFVLSPGAVRLILAAAVMFSHLTSLDIGRLAVLLFFYLSGYWTTRIWQEKFGPGSTLRFYLARYWRIAPLFFVMTLISAWIRQEGLGLTNFTLLGLAATGEASDPTRVSWSLDIELQFYLLLPLLIPFLTHSPWRVLAGSIALVGLGWWLDAQYGFLTVMKFLPAFILGCVTHLRAWRPSARAAGVSLGLFLAATAATAATPIFWKDVDDPIDRDVYGLFWMLPLLPYVAHSLTIKSTSLDRHFGNLSFPLYLVHPAIIASVAQIGVTGPVAKLTVIVVATLAALATYFVLDRPIDRLRVRFTEGVRSKA